MKQLEIQVLQQNTKKACAFTGHRELGKDFSPLLLKKKVENLITQENVDIFYVGMAMGFDLIAAETVLKLKKNYAVKLIACIPFYGQEKYFSEKDKKRYFEILKNCDERITVSEKYLKGCLLKRNRYKVDNADFLIAYLKKDTGGTAYTVNYYLKNKNNPVIYV